MQRGTLRLRGSMLPRRWRRVPVRRETCRARQEQRLPAEDSQPDLPELRERLLRAPLLEVGSARRARPHWPEAGEEEVPARAYSGRMQGALRQ